MDPMEALARAAEEHTRREHGVELDSVETADRVLASASGHVESLAASYGAWLGRLAVRRFGARWVGLAEPVPPRLLVGGVPSSPIDAVRRRLQDPKAPSLVEILARFERWARDAEAARAAAAANAGAWDRLAGAARFAGASEAGELDPWLLAEGVRGRDVLCLAAGGGRHGPLLVREGARVTVVDASDAQLEHDRRAGLRTIRASIDRLEGLPDASFDLVVQPVSSCYVPDVARVHAEVARVLRPGGLYVVQHKQPGSLQADGPQPSVEGALLPPAAGAHREAGTAEYLHTLDALLGGLCRAGFVIEDVEEPPRGDALAPPGSPAHRAWFHPPYLKIKARRENPRSRPPRGRDPEGGG
jgi:SAM-dependent methyltransferase